MNIKYILELLELSDVSKMEGDGECYDNVKKIHKLIKETTILKDGYYAKFINSGHYHEFEWGENNEFFVYVNGHRFDDTINQDLYEIVQIIDFKIVEAD